MKPALLLCLVGACLGLRPCSGHTLRGIPLLETRTARRVMPKTAGPCLAPHPCQGSINAAWDSAGVPDTRPDTWGTAGAVQIPFQFSPPEGYRVRVLRLAIDLVAWPHGKAEPETDAGVLFGFLTTAPGGSSTLAYSSDDCFLYHQAGVAAQPSPPTNVYYNEDVSAGGLLEPDALMILQMAVFLSELNVPVHLEVTGDVLYQFEPGG